MTSAAEMVLYVAGAWTVGGGYVDIRDVLHRGGSGSALLEVRVVGNFPADWNGAGRIPPSGDKKADGADATS